MKGSWMWLVEKTEVTLKILNVSIVFYFYLIARP